MGLIDAAAIAGLCAVLAHGAPPAQPPDGVTCPPAVASAAAPPVKAKVSRLADRVSSPDARAGIARVSFAEAGNQGDSGLAAVVYTILNRLADGRWGDTIDGVLNARDQFEPVLRVGGDWRRLAPVSPTQQARIDTILNLALDGRLPDLTNGARYFQNPRIVAARAQSGEVSPSLVDFGGQPPSAIIGAHSFYAGAGGRRGAPAVVASATMPGIGLSGGASIFVGENRALRIAGPPSVSALPDTPSATQQNDPSRGLFVSRDGVVSEVQP
jgi:spore germination cell wall hydrolase CwlJ-like protein